MRIVHILWNFQSGGTENMLVDIANEQCEYNSVYILVIGNVVNKDLITRLDPRITFYSCGRPTQNRNPFYIFLFNIKLLCINPNIIHCHSEGLIKYVVIPYIKKVRTIHSTLCSGRDYKYYKKLFCISNAVQSYTNQQGYYNTTVVYNGIHPEKIKTKKVLCKNDNSTARVLCVGRLENSKGHYLLIEAFKLLKNKDAYKKLSLDIIGEGSNKDELISLITTYSLEDKIHLLGEKSREFIYDKICEYDLYVQPSISEGFGLTIVEAMCAKIPVLVSNLDGPLEVIGNGSLGMSFKCEDAVDLANKLQLYLSKGAEWKMVEEAYKYAILNFDIKKTARKYVEEYKLVCYEDN